MSGPLTGLIPASHTPLGPDGTLDLGVVEQQAELILESGIRSVFVGGTTGEFASLSLEERMALAERWCSAAGGSLRVAVHVGHNCLPEALTLAAHARKSGATAIAIMAPCYFKPASVQDLIDFCAPIAAEADPLPFYFYDIPAMTGVRLRMSEFLYQARFRIPTLRGLKYSNDDLLDLQECVRLDHGAFDVLLGSDECLLAGLCLGIRGAVGSTYNFAAPALSETDKSLRETRPGDRPRPSGTIDRPHQDAGRVRFPGGLQVRHGHARRRVRARPSPRPEPHP